MYALEARVVVALGGGGDWEGVQGVFGVLTVISFLI